MATSNDDAQRLKREERERQEAEMWKGVAEYFACDGTCELCNTLNYRGKRRTDEMGREMDRSKCKPNKGKPKRK